MTRFEPGEGITWRARTAQWVGLVWTRTVVIDSDDVIALYTPPGSPGMRRTGERGGPRDRLLVRWDGGYEEMTWRGKELLVVYRPGDPYSFWWAWDAATWELSWRYINLEDPWQRTSIGFDSHDRDLDLDAMGTDGEWRWKDEDEVAWRVANGQYTQAVADEVRATGERALEQVLRRVPPLDRPWAEWRPDRSWAMPTLAPDWKELVPKRR